MTEQKKVDLTTVFLGVIMTIMIVGVPWGYSVGNRLARIETKLEMITGVEVQIAKHELRIDEMATRLAIIENNQGG